MTVEAFDQVDALPLRRRLAFRIVALFLGLLLVVQVVTFTIVQRSIDHNARELLGASLDLGDQVFKRLLQQSATHLSESTRLLAADFGFREALSSGDQETVVSVLENHGERVGASLAAITDPQGAIEASIGPASKGVPDLVKSAIQHAESADQTTSSGLIVKIEERVYQLVAVPIRAPLVIGWVVMGFELDDRLVRDMKQLIELVEEDE